MMVGSRAVAIQGPLRLTDSHRTRILLQYPDQGNPMEQTTRALDSSRGEVSSRHLQSSVNSLQRALANQPWKEYTTPEGRKYWNNTETKASSWEMPEAYKNALAQSQPPARPAP